MFWRPILAGVATLAEIDSYWTLCDLLEANEVLDTKEAVEKHYKSVNEHKNKRY